MPTLTEIQVRVCEAIWIELKLVPFLCLSPCWQLLASATLAQIELLLVLYNSVIDYYLRD